MRAARTVKATRPRARRKPVADFVTISLRPILSDDQLDAVVDLLAAALVADIIRFPMVEPTGS